MNAFKRIICITAIVLGFFNLLDAKHHKEKKKTTKSLVSLKWALTLCRMRKSCNQSWMI